MSSIVEKDPVYVGRARRAPRAAFDDRVLKAIFLVDEQDTFDPGVRREELIAVIHQARVRESLLDGYYTGLALLHASADDLARWPVLLEPGRTYWVMGATELFSLSKGAAGNWREGDGVRAAKGALGAQIYRVQAMLLGATHNSGAMASTRATAILDQCSARIKPRLEGILRAVGSRKKGDDWSSYVSELRENFGSPTLRRLYEETAGARSKLAIGTHWQREGRDLAIGIENLASADMGEVVGPEMKLLDFAADLLARATIAERDGIAVANRQGEADEASKEAIVDIYSVPDLGLATEASLRWDINPADYYYRLGAFRGFFDAVRALGIYQRLHRVELPALASFGIRALMSGRADEYFDPSFASVLSSVRQQMPSALLDAANAASRDVPDRLHGADRMLTWEQIMSLIVGSRGEKEDPPQRAALD